MDGYSLLCADHTKGIFLYQNGKDFKVVHEFKGGSEIHYIVRKTIHEGFEEAEEKYYQLIKEN